MSDTVRTIVDKNKIPAIRKPSVCQVCGEGKQISFLREHRKGNHTFSLFECSSCGVQFWTPFVNPGRHWYEKDNAADVRDMLTPELYRGYHRKFLAQYRGTFAKGATLLDIGCGTGEFLAEVQKWGVEVWGIDFDREAIKVARKHFSLAHLYAVPYEEFFDRVDIPQFDMITAFEVLEHVDKPRMLIQGMNSNLKPDGRIILTTPNRERLLANLAAWDFPPHHLTRWNRAVLSQFLERMGFEIVKYDYVDKFMFLTAAVNAKFRMGMVQKTANAVRSSRNFTFLPRLMRIGGIIKEYVIGAIPASVLLLYGIFIGRPGGSLFVEARKRRI